jgi:hypothetical protein
MSTHPFPWPSGQPQSMRASLYKKLDLAASMGLDNGIVDAQHAALAAGRPVPFTTAQLRSFYPRGDEHHALPPDLCVAEAWVLTDDDVLSPAS